MLFLIIFEAVFMISRIILEDSVEEGKFQEETDHIIQMLDRRAQGRTTPLRTSSDINVMILTQSWWIIINNNPLTESWELDLAFLNNLEGDTILKQDGFLYRKITDPNTGTYTIYFYRSSYAWEDIIRDILRFLVLDLIILGPLWFMSYRVVRQTLTPVEKSIDAMAHFVHDAGHELKTPLSVISGNLQILRDFPEKRESLIANTIDTVNTLGESIDGLLMLSNLEKWNTRINIHLADAIHDEVGLLTEEITAKNLHVTEEISKNSTLMMDRGHFHLLIRNILENAIKYNKEWGSITIRYAKNILTIQDTGKGIPKEEYEKIFGRFYRIEKNTTNGSGIGLAIVDRITHIYGWKCEVESEVGIGTTFSIRVK